MVDLSAASGAAIHHDATTHATHFGDTCDPGDAPKELSVFVPMHCEIVSLFYVDSHCDDSCNAGDALKSVAVFCYVF